MHIYLHLPEMLPLVEMAKTRCIRFSDRIDTETHWSPAENSRTCKSYLPAMLIAWRRVRLSPRGPPLSPPKSILILISTFKPVFLLFNENSNLQLRCWSIMSKSNVAKLHQSPVRDRLLPYLWGARHGGFRLLPSRKRDTTNFANKRNLLRSKSKKREDMSTFSSFCLQRAKLLRWSSKWTHHFRMLHLQTLEFSQKTKYLTQLVRRGGTDATIAVCSQEYLQVIVFAMSVVNNVTKS